MNDRARSTFALRIGIAGFSGHDERLTRPGPSWAKLSTRLPTPDRTCTISPVATFVMDRLKS